MHHLTDRRVAVYPFVRQQEGKEVVIGNLNTSIFLVLPSEAVELLDNLAQGKKICEVQREHQHKYNEIPDLEELLNILEQKGFVKVLPENVDYQPPFFINTFDKKSSQKSKLRRYHFANFPQDLAQKLFARRVMLGCGIIIGLALITSVFEPSLIPGWEAQFFKKNLTLMRLSFLLIDYFTLFLHEMAHLIAARAVGISSRLGISNRMWYLVAETDITGVWSVPRSQRYIPFLAGSLLDATSASLLIIIFFIHIHGWLILHPIVFQMGQALLLSYLMRLLWQCYLFIRTDFYFVIANFFCCKNLMQDTEAFLHNQLARIIRSMRKVDQSHIPLHEKRVIYWYSWFWIIGRIAALSSLICITIPLLWNYCVAIFMTLSAGYQTNPYAFLDALVMGLLIFTRQSVGYGLWIRSFLKAKR